MADVELDNGALEQRVRKPRGAAADDEVPDFGAVEDFSAPEPEANGFGTTPEATDVETDIAAPAYKLYFVRVPRPPVNEEALKKLQAQFKEHVDKLKGMNAKMQVKRVSFRYFAGRWCLSITGRDVAHPTRQ